MTAVDTAKDTRERIKGLVTTNILYMIEHGKPVVELELEILTITHVTNMTMTYDLIK